MDPVEIGILIFVSISIGMIILGFFNEWDYMKTYREIKSMFFGEEETKFEKIEVKKLPKTILKFWEKCDIRENDLSKSIYLIGEGSFTKESFFGMLINASLCYTIQSKEYNCGVKETFKQFPDIELPAVIRILCRNHSLYIS